MINCHHQAPLRFTLCAGLITLISLSGLSYAESLFRAGTSYQQAVGYTPTSIIAQPIPHTVGDIVTISVNEQTTLTNSASLSIERDQTLTDNKATILSNLLHSVGVPRSIEFPGLNGINSENALDSTAAAQRNTQLTDTVTCQVVQVLPNGNLVVQGEKIVLVNKDRVNMVVSGIVNPYYVDSNNTIASTQVANFQMLMGGQGVINRQQNDGLTNKLYNVFQ